MCRKGTGRPPRYQIDVSRVSKYSIIQVQPSCFIEQHPSPLVPRPAAGLAGVVCRVLPCRRLYSSSRSEPALHISPGMPFSDFAKQKIQSLHLSKKTTIMPTGALPPRQEDSDSNAPQIYNLGPMPITPRTADPLISSFPRSRSPSPERRPRSNNGDGTNTKGSSTTAASVKSKSSQSSWARKAPSFTEAPIATTTITAGGKTVGGGYDSPPLTSDLFSRHSASSRSEEAWLVHSRRLRWARLALSFLIMACAVGALGCSGAAYHAYRSTLLGPEWHLRLWPVDLDLRPTLVVLGSAAVVTVASGLYLGLALWPSVCLVFHRSVIVRADLDISHTPTPLVSLAFSLCC
jgi:hypothetical protein